MKLSTIGVWLVLAITLISTSACRSKPSDQPDLGKVTGVVTMDGAPLSGVEVSFAPAEGRASQGITDSEGKYELIYIGKTKGAKLGSHKVYITTPIEDESDPDAQMIKEVVPAKYNKNTTLTAMVEPGKNPIDFKLESK
jgi:hypothetical protein